MLLKRFLNGTSRAVSDILTGDNTWIYHYDPETKRQSQKWVEEGAPPKILDLKHCSILPIVKT